MTIVKRAALGLAFAWLLLEGLVRADHIVRHQLLGGSVAPFEQAIYAAYDPADQAAVTASIQDRRRLRFEPHPFLLYRPVPGQRLGTIMINQRGLRGPDWDPSARYHVVLLGGSAVYGSGALDDARTIAGYLQAEAQRRWPERRVQVLNAGMDGFTSTQERILFEQEFSGQADAVLLFDGINDMYSATLYTGDRIGYPETFQEYERRIRHPVAQAVDRLLTHSMLYEKMRRRIVTLLERSQRVAQGAEGRRRDVALMRDRYVRNLRLLRAVAGPRVPVIACLQPMILRGSKTLAPSEEAIRRREARWGYKVDDAPAYMAEAYGALLAAAPELSRDGVRLVDFGDVFTNEREPLYIDPVHFSDQGHRLVAERLADELGRAMERR